MCNRLRKEGEETKRIFNLIVGDKLTTPLQKKKPPPQKKKQTARSNEKETTKDE